MNIDGGSTNVDQPILCAQEPDQHLLPLLRAPRLSGRLTKVLTDELPGARRASTRASARDRITAELEDTLGAGKDDSE